ncbi:MAG TPA: DinB family protein [Mycobacterium sp.]|nr:DinB family protein [Mycobacterium sp.]
MNHDASPNSQERQALVSSLADQRNHVLGILEGLSEEDLRRPILPSGWTCAGLVQHLAFDVERFWFRAIVAGEPILDDEPDNAWQVPADSTAATVIDSYRREIERADAVIAATSLDSPPAWWPEDLFGNWRLDDLREILLHVIAETATHAGHLDAARELIDGRQWIVLTE